MPHKFGPFLILLAMTLGSSGVTLGHHGLSAYDEKNPVVVKGTVTEFDWSNPHSQIYFDAKDEKGTVTHWTCETLNPARLLRAGWTKRSLKPGDQITITMIAAKNGAPVGFLRKLTLEDGTELGVLQQEQ